MRLIVPVLAALTACGDNLHPDEDQVAVGAEEADEEDPAPVPEPRAIVADFGHDPLDCADHSMFFVARATYADDFSSVDADCHWDFGDGTTAFGCFVTHSFPDDAGRLVVLTVRDPATGVVARHEEGVTPPASFSATADVTTNGLSISWDVETNYGGFLDTGNAQVMILPTGDGTWIPGLQGTVQVPEAGTYTVRVNAFVSFGENGGCGVVFDKIVNVICEKE